MLTKALIRRFIKDPDSVALPSVRTAYGKLAGSVGLACNILLFLLKLLAGVLSGSVAIVADAFNNLSDAGSSVVTLVGFRLAGSPPDAEHPFGHGRVEYLSALTVAALIMLAGFELAGSAVEKIVHPTPSAFSWLTIAILAASIVVKLWMAGFHYTTGKHIRSSTLLSGFHMLQFASHVLGMNPLWNLNPACLLPKFLNDFFMNHFFLIAHCCTSSARIFFSSFINALRYLDLMVLCLRPKILAISSPL